MDILTAFFLIFAICCVIIIAKLAYNAGIESVIESGMNNTVVEAHGKKYKVIVSRML